MITIRSIRKNYGKKTVLRDVSLTVEPGKCIGILGTNGCGKSTLLNILAGIIKPSGGSFELDGTDLFKKSKLRAQKVGYVPQGTPLFEELTALDNLRLWYGKEEMDHQLSDGVLAMLGVDKFLKVPVHKMSGGMKKRLSIGCAVAHRPEILLLDEPSAALDLVCKTRISNYLQDYKEQGGTIIIATHDVQELPLCDELFILKDGALEKYSFDGNINRLAGSL